VDVAQRWRAVDDLSIPKRLVGGSLQGARDATSVLIQLTRFRPHLVHITTTGSLAGVRDVAILLLARLFRTRAVYHIRFGSIPQIFNKGGWERRLLHTSMLLAHRVLVVDARTETALSPMLPTSKLLLVPNGIDLGTANSTQASRPKQANVAYFLGWVVPTKGVEELVEAWRAAGRDDWELRVAGPSDQAYRSALAKAVGDHAHVRFLGEVSHSEGSALMDQADIFVLPSHTEGFPNVILEAMAAGKAIVATRVGAIPEMLDADTSTPCGLLIGPKDAPALAEALRALMKDPSLRRELGARARSKVERCYDVNVVFRRLLEAWEGTAQVGGTSRCGQARATPGTLPPRSNEPRHEKRHHVRKD
jgi:glycosyltransferase involved in cell wall biosynthesis